MTRVGEAVFSILAANGAVTTLVGTAPVRVYPKVLRQSGALPGAVYQVIADTPTLSLGGFTSNQQHAIVQIDCYDRSYSGAQSLADAVVAALGSYTTPSLTSSLTARRDLRDDGTDLHRVSLDFSLWSQ